MLTAGNFGPQINFINGINGVQAGGNALVNFAVNRRFSRLKYQCAAVNYTGGTLLATKHLTGGGNDALVVTLTVTANQVPNVVTPTTAGNGYNVGDTFSIIDPTGTGAVFTVATLTGGAGSGVATATYNGGTATASPIDPGLLVSTVKQLVNGVNMRDITARFMLMIAQANGRIPLLGELPVFYAEPWRDIVRNNLANSWDLSGQSTFEHQIAINPGYLLPSITGIQEFDFGQNTIVQNGKTVNYLEPVSQHAFTLQLNTGANVFNTLPITYPIVRLWLLGSNPGNITQVELKQDANVVQQVLIGQLLQDYADRGFQFGQANFANQNQTAAKPLGLNPLKYFDAAYISDPDNRYYKALKVGNEMVLTVYSAVQQQLTVIMETLPGAYRA